jgi:hypothetical protein
MRGLGAGTSWPTIGIPRPYMLRRITIAELQQTNVAVRYDESIAIAQRLIEVSLGREGAAEVRPPYGPPTLSNVFLDQAGTVTCAGCDARLAVSEIGVLLQQLLALDTGRVPGAVRYTVARAMLEVDAPPFDSLEDFSEALARYERGDRDAALGRLVQRAAAAHTSLAAAPLAADRRRGVSDVAELRRQLRDADARVYDQQRALDALGAMAAIPPAARGPRRLAVGAGIAAGLVLIGAGETMRLRTPADIVLVPSHTVATSSAPRVEVLPAVTEPAATTMVVNPPRKSEPQAMQTASPAPSAQAAPKVSRRISSSPSRQSQGLLRRLRMNWLRTKISIRHDVL